MSKAVMISIQPKWCDHIASGKKTIEVRKTAPKIDTPFKCYIYCTSIKKMPLAKYVEIHRATGGKIDDWHGKVIGEFVCDRVYEVKNQVSRFMIDNDISLTNRIAKESCLDYYDMRAYLGDKDGYGLHISNLVIYDKSKELGEFKTPPCEKSEKYCEDCKYKHHDFNGEIYCKDDNRVITSPPQSWYYVEEKRV